MPRVLGPLWVQAEESLQCLLNLDEHVVVLPLSLCYSEVVSVSAICNSPSSA